MAFFKFPLTPPFLRLSGWIILFALLLSVGAIAFVCFSALWEKHIGMAWRGLATGALAPLSGAIIAISMLRTRRQTKARYIAGELMCWQCGFDLASLGAHGLCPECGSRYESKELWERWINLYSMWPMRAFATVSHTRRTITTAS